MAILRPEIYVQMFNVEMAEWTVQNSESNHRDIYPGRIDMIIYQIYQLVGGFPSKFVSSRISQNIFFHMIGNKSFHFIFGRGGGGAFPKLVYTFKRFIVKIMQQWEIRGIPVDFGIVIFIFSSSHYSKQGLCSAWTRHWHQYYE